MTFCLPPLASAAFDAYLYASSRLSVKKNPSDVTSLARPMSYLVPFDFSNTSKTCEVPWYITFGSPFSSMTFDAFSGSLSQSPNQSLKACVLTSNHCRVVRFEGSPFGASINMPSSMALSIMPSSSGVYCLAISFSFASNSMTI